jgi:arsenate reductase (thioredoxin)
VANVLFVCIHNAGRSQMAQALLEKTGSGHVARSAGSRPAARVHDEVVAVMRDVGIDLAGRQPHLLTSEDARWADVVVTMGCGDECPVVPGARYIDWQVDDPAGRPLAEVRRIRDDIAARVAELRAALDGDRAARAGETPVPGTAPSP